jgi:hypothetical protein
MAGVLAGQPRREKRREGRHDVSGDALVQLLGSRADVLLLDAKV